MRFLLFVLSVVCCASNASAQTYPYFPDKMPPRALLDQMLGPGGIAAPYPPRTLIKVARELIELAEGWEPNVYNDAMKYCTIGYGHLIALQPCEKIDLGKFRDGLTKQQGSELLEKDTISARLSVQRLVRVPLNDEQFGALTSFTFNLGEGALASSTLLRRVNDNELDLAAQEFPRWVKAGSQVLKGLVDRRACERLLFTGDLKTAPAKLADCSTAGVAQTAAPLIDVLVGE